ncbi:hypothetical protein CH304_17375 [Rhodococcus sp. 15-649-1-2]|nr:MULTISPECIES: DUF4286 family protein [unclassified Rhodococcus (in: high G+C Gram-positive bacteria)]OZC76315.1 hypothetical protein CH282_25880 [Rhodococcus sp. 06-418-1B]OZE80166.1 hypothetical protein CH304_17375 [Rhodococcus sp. 15-649-1-2]
MAKALLLAWSSPTAAETQTEFDNWYNGTHIPQIRDAVPSITAAHRYRLSEPTATGTGRYLTVYEMDDADVGHAGSLLMDAVNAGRIDFTTAMDTTNEPPSMHWYIQHT